jgi:hypothetical protein
MASGKGNTFINDLLKLIFNATAIANIADNAAASPLTNLFCSLHTATLTAAATQTTSEAVYTSYARVSVARTTGGWTAASAQVTNPVAAITFPAATGGSETETYFAIGTLVSGAGKVLYWGAISPSIVVTSGVTPQLTTASSVTEA